MRIRQALNVEAGLNDGLSVPFLMFFIALAAARHRRRRRELDAVHRGAARLTERSSASASAWPAAGCWVWRGARTGWRTRCSSSASSRCRCSACSPPRTAGASMFIAAFVAGLAVQVGFKEAGKHSVEFTEEWGSCSTSSVFFLFGLLVARSWPQFSPAYVLYAILSLTVVRMLPVAIALAGTRSEPGRPCCSWAGSARAGWRPSCSGWSIWSSEAHSARRVHHPARGDGDRAAQHLRARPERPAGHRPLRQSVAALDPGAPEHQAIEETIPG